MFNSLDVLVDITVMVNIAKQQLKFCTRQCKKQQICIDSTTMHLSSKFVLIQQQYILEK